MQVQIGATGREYWVQKMIQVVHPVLINLSNRQLKKCLPVDRKERDVYSHLEAIGRTLAGTAPWLESKAMNLEEEKLRNQYIQLTLEAIDAVTDPTSPDYVNFTQGYQPIVDAAFFAHGLLRAPTQILDSLDKRVKGNVIQSLNATRTRKPGFSNWLLFGAMIEVALHRLGSNGDPMRIDYALRQHMQWYKGDGAYGDGPDFHWDYYNSYVIQPMLIDIIDIIGDQDPAWKSMKKSVLIRAGRYAEVQERFIAPDGSFPPMGRSLAYRCGAFQHLAQMALQHRLPNTLQPAQVRCALEAVIRRTLDAPETFDAQGWLKIGLCGHQPELGETYISNGSLYLCTTAFLPLGLAEVDPFWSTPNEDWTSRLIWSGQNHSADHALHE